MGKKKKRKKRQKEEKQKIKASRKNTKIVVIALLLLAIYVLSSSSGSNKWSISEEGLIKYPQKRGKPVYTINIIEEGEEFILKKAVYESKGTKIYSLIYLPKSDKKVPGIVIAPGAGPTKEDRIEMAKSLANLGFASIILDQRTFGETKGTVSSFDQDKLSMMKGIEPDQHKMVFDILIALDVLRDQKEVDTSKTVLIGESMGGRFSIIAAAIDKSLKGIIGISTGGYGTQERQDSRMTKEQLKFFTSIDPDAYIGLISPRKIVMIHYDNDTIIPLSVAENTYSHANEPRKFYTLQGNGHGYYTELDSYLKEELMNWEW